jgi:hypothetical protein
MGWMNVLKANTIAEKLEKETKDWWESYVENQIDDGEHDYNPHGAYGEIMRRVKNITRNIRPSEEYLTDDFDTWYYKKHQEMLPEEWFLEPTNSEIGEKLDPLYNSFLTEYYTDKYMTDKWEETERSTQSAARTQAGEMGLRNYEEGTWYGD